MVTLTLACYFIMMIFMATRRVAPLTVLLILIYLTDFGPVQARAYLSTKFLQSDLQVISTPICTAISVDMMISVMINAARLEIGLRG